MQHTVLQAVQWILMVLLTIATWWLLFCRDPGNVILLVTALIFSLADVAFLVRGIRPQ